MQKRNKQRKKHEPPHPTLALVCLWSAHRTDGSHLTRAWKQSLWYFIFPEAYVCSSPSDKSNLFSLRLVSTYYTAYDAACPSSIYPASDSITFDNGTHGTYNVSYPDVVSAVNGGVADLHYKTATTDLAGIHYAGVYPGGTKTGKMVYLCFPFETIYPATARDTVMKRIIRFFDGTSGTTTGVNELTEVSNVKLFPNPVQGVFQIEFNLVKAERIQVEVYDAMGKSIQLLTDQTFSEGVHQLSLSSTEWSPGLYFAAIRTASGSKRIPFIKQ